MGSAKAKGAGAGAISGAAAGSAFGPIGTGIGALAGGAFGYFGSEETPEYQQPAMDPAYALLLEQQKKQQIEATQQGLRRQTASLAARYGTAPGTASAGAAPGPTPVNMEPSSILARYGAMLAQAGR